MAISYTSRYQNQIRRAKQRSKLQEAERQLSNSWSVGTSCDNMTTNFIHTPCNSRSQDDHDFGKNNGGKEYGSRWESQRLFLDFVEEPQNSTRWNQEGVYTSYTVGPKGKRVKIIMLDTRYSRDEDHTGKSLAVVNGDPGSILDEAQWKWLEKEMKSSDAQINIITSGIQVLPADKPIQEKFANYRTSYERLFTLIRSTGCKGKMLLIIVGLKGAFFLSGDVHYGEIFKRDCGGSLGVGYPLYQLWYICDLIFQDMKSPLVA